MADILDIVVDVLQIVLLLYTITLVVRIVNQVE